MGVSCGLSRTFKGIVDGEAVLVIGFLGKDTKKQGDTK